jgi:phospholipid/cholesterol/gamma-HCH transport system substrate-binding protein
MLKRMSGMSIQMRTGVFVLLGLAVLTLAVFILGERQQLFSSRYRVYATYTDVSGLQQGAFCRIAGINVGTVSHISLPDSVTARVRVTFRVRGDAQRLIRTDSRAIIDTEGLLGSRIVIITQGSASAPVVPEGGEILGQSPIQLHRFTQNIDRALEDLDDVVMNAAAALASMSAVMTKINTGRGSIGALLNRRTLHDSLVVAVSQYAQLARSSDELVNELRARSRTITIQANTTLGHYQTAADSLTLTLSEFGKTSREVRMLTTDIRAGRGTLGRLMTDDSAYVALTGMLVSGDTMLKSASLAITDIIDVSRSIATSAQQIEKTVSQVTGDIRSGRGTLGKFVTDDSAYVKLIRTLSHLEIASQKTAVNMEAVRTNWLFRGYFEDKGYWDDLEKKIETNAQREYRLKEWEERLKQAQKDLESKDRGIRERERAIRKGAAKSGTAQ